jgi:hypothetical protein
MRVCVREKGVGGVDEEYVEKGRCIKFAFAFFAGCGISCVRITTPASMKIPCATFFLRVFLTGFSCLLGWLCDFLMSFHAFGSMTFF